MTFAIAPFSIEVSADLANEQSLNYRVSDDECVFFYAGADNNQDSFADYINGVDLAVLPLREDVSKNYSVSALQNLTLTLDTILLFASLHPALTDNELTGMNKHLQNELTSRNMYIACQDLRVDVSAKTLDWPIGGEHWFNELRNTLVLYKDKSVILDHILLKSRELTRADAGTVYTRNGNELIFSYTHNDSLFPVQAASKYAYVNMSIPVSPRSITGYVATTRKNLNIADVYNIPAGAPYSFNSNFDDETGYRTVSALTVPIISRTGVLLGVMQLLNSLDHKGRPTHFTNSMEHLITLLAEETAGALENNKNVLSGINRLLRIINMQDSAETASHATRVGAIAAELYQHWAHKQGIDAEDIRYYKSQLRLAAMLHDIGKIGISEYILKNDGNFTPQQRATMLRHTLLGAELIGSGMDDISELGAETALHHHQKWDGSWQSEQQDIPTLSGTDIPLSARITSLADVFDSFVHPRAYPNTWTFDDSVVLVQRESGKYFDPELVDCFIEILDIIKAIYKRYPAKQSEL